MRCVDVGLANMRYVTMLPNTAPYLRTFCKFYVVVNMSFMKPSSAPLFSWHLIGNGQSLLLVLGMW